MAANVLLFYLMKNFPKNDIYSQFYLRKVLNAILCCTFLMEHPALHIDIRNQVSILLLYKE